MLTPSRHPVVDLVIITCTGWTKDEILEGVHQTVVEGKYDLVTVFLIVNNQYHNRSRDKFRYELAIALEVDIEFATVRSGHMIGGGWITSFIQAVLSLGQKVTFYGIRS